MDSPTPNLRLVVFSDDWGRHPSSCQHLVRHLLDRHPTIWVNTIGTRAPRLTLEDAGKAATKIVQWLRPSRTAQQSVDLPANLRVVTPRMWPGFRARWQRRYNAKRVSKTVNDAMQDNWGPRDDSTTRVALTTLPITADLVGRLDVDRWVYYCVDDFSVWPGLDATVMQDMEQQQVTAVDSVVAVSDTLIERLNGMGRRDVSLLTHGIDLSHWTRKSEPPPSESGRAGPVPPVPPLPAVSPDDLPNWWPRNNRPIFLFWGLIDPRLDTGWCRSLAESLNGGRLLLVGPTQSPDAGLSALATGPNAPVVMPGPAAYDDLPTLAAAADVLVMPYDDLPVTRAMQPLKFKEYLATGKPVVVRDLPATREWLDAADVLDNAEAFIKVCHERATSGIPDAQRQARQRLDQETWEEKARTLEAILGDDGRE